MKRGGSLDNTSMFLVVIVVLNAIAYASVKDWKALSILIFAGIASYTFENKGIVLFVGILAAALSRSIYIEGMKNGKKMKTEKTEKTEKSEKKIPENTDIIDGDATTIKGASLEGLSQHAEKLAKRQTDLFAMAKELGPMMKQAENMMNKLPQGFLENAMKNFNKRKE
jgi:hypothetical protein